MRGSEIVVWQDLDTLRGKHAQAFKTLQGERAHQIARKLGMGDPAAAQQCLSCHSDDPLPGRRGPQLLRSDGVSCEACHGGAGGRWLAAHYAPGATHAQNITGGLYPTDDPAARARLCQSCHIGSAAADQYVTHKMMAAGHPRLTFELELFTALQAHHFEDQDYDRRKPIPNRAKVWAIGQALAFRTDVDLFLSSPHANAGVFPEETFFDCRSCHRQISDSDDYRPSARPNPGRPLDPGTPVFNDADLIVLTAALRAISPAQADQLDVRGRAFHAALQGDSAEVRPAGAALSNQLGEIASTLERTRFDPALARRMLAGIVSQSLSSRYTTYASAEQAIMAVDTLARTLADVGRVLPPPPPKPGAQPDSGVLVAQAPSPQQIAAQPRPVPGRTEIDAAYRTVADPNTYDQEAFRKAIARVGVKLGLT